MQIFLANFFRNLERILHENRAKLIKALVIGAAAIAGFLLIRAGVERWQKSRYEKRIQTLEKQFQDADGRAKSAEGRAAGLGYEIEARKAELANLQARSAATDKKLAATRTVVIPLKEEYEKARNNPVITGSDPACADVCTELADLGYPCR